MPELIDRVVKAAEAQAQETVAALSPAKVRHSRPPCLPAPLPKSYVNLHGQFAPGLFDKGCHDIGNCAINMRTSTLKSMPSAQHNR